MPSCIRLPPVAGRTTTGSRRARASRCAAEARAPVRSPMEPPRKRNSKESSTTCTPPIVPVPQITDSVSPERAAARPCAAE